MALLASMSENRKSHREAMRTEEERRSRLRQKLAERILAKPRSASASGCRQQESVAAPLQPEAEVPSSNGVDLQPDGPPPTATEREDEEDQEAEDKDGDPPMLQQKSRTSSAPPCKWIIKAEERRLKKEREQIQKAWRAHRARTAVLAMCKSADLKDPGAKPPPVPPKTTFHELAEAAGLNHRRASQDSDCESESGTESDDDGTTAADDPNSTTSTDCSASPTANTAPAVEATPVTVTQAPSPSQRVAQSSRRRASKPVARTVTMEKALEPKVVDGAAAEAAATGPEPQEPEKRDLSPTMKKARKTKLQATSQSIATWVNKMSSTRNIGVRSLHEWKRRNQVESPRKVFVVLGGYPDFARAMERRGWLRNRDPESPFFDLKWTLQARDIDHSRLKDDQVTNHFQKNREITTKVGLGNNLKTCKWITDHDMDEFFPRCFDLSDPLERHDFVEDFKMTKAQAVLRLFLKHLEGKTPMTFSATVMQVALAVWERALREPDDVIDHPTLAETAGNITKNEWKLLRRVDLDRPGVELPWDGTATKKEKTRLEQLEDHFARNLERIHAPKTEEEKLAAEMREKEEAKKKKPAEKKKKALTAVEELGEDPATTVLGTTLDAYENPKGQRMVSEVQRVVGELKTTLPQFPLDGTKNAWIMKPAGKSRGRGIAFSRDLEGILKETSGEEEQWICQKYIENPQLIHGYKFDIRQWVLVVDWNPLTVYRWNEPYLRFAASKYDDSLMDDDPFIHLVNNSISKDHPDFYKQNEELCTNGYMWFRQQYQKWLHDTQCTCGEHNFPPVDIPFTCENMGINFDGLTDEQKNDPEALEEMVDAAAEEAQPDEKASETADASKDADGDGATTPKMALEETMKAETDSSDPVEPSSGASPQAAGASPTASGARAASSSQHKPSCPRCPDIYETEVVPQMNNIITWSLASVMDSIEHRKNSCELFGYDFMLADDNSVYLIEVNSSPAMDYSTRVTAPLVRQVMEDVAKVIVDLPANENPGDSPDTGSWVKLDTGSLPTVTRAMVGARLDVVGKAMNIQTEKAANKKKKKSKKKKKTTEEGGDDDGDEDDA